MARTRRRRSARAFFLALAALSVLLLYRISLPGKMWQAPEGFEGAEPHKNALVVASLAGDDISWLQGILPDWEKNIYVADNLTAPLSPPKNKGRESMIYLTFIIDNYDHLPDITAFIHSLRYQWHNDDPIYDGIPVLQNLQLPHVVAEGYVNLRCAWVLGCPGAIKPIIHGDNGPIEEKYYAEGFKEIFLNTSVPEVVGVGCCAQFVVTRDKLRERPKEDYERYRQWLLSTPLKDDISGRIMEYSWHTGPDRKNSSPSYSNSEESKPPKRSVRLLRISPPIESSSKLPHAAPGSDLLFIMKTSNGVSSAGLLASTNRRQPVRQTRTASLRTSVTASGAFGDRGSHQGGLDTGQTSNSAPGFFPAITHFTDSISALPKEIIRHFTLLKEVDAKVFGPEETLGQLVAVATNTPAPPPKPVTLPSSTGNATETMNATAVGGTSSATVTSGHQTKAQADGDDTDMARRSLFYNLRAVVAEMLMTLDEKNHVLSTATEALNKQLARVDSSFPYIENEISEEARYGSLMHWAYADKTATRGNGTTAGERSRRDVAAANNLAAAAAAVHEGETAVSRSESRREAMLARKQRNVHADSDFDDGRQSHPINATGALRKPQGAGKVRKAVDAPGTTNGASLGLGITNGPTNTVSTIGNKRRRTEKPATNTGNGIPALEKPTSTVMQTNGVGTRIGAGSPRETPAVEGSRKRARGGAPPSGPARKRNNTTTSAAGPPYLISSPVVSTSTLAKESRRGSPIPSASAPQRPPSSRARQNSAQSARPESHQRAPSSASNKQTNTNGVSAATTNTNTLPGSTSRNRIETQNATKDDETTVAEIPIEAKAERAPRDSSKPLENGLKREDTEPSNPTPKAHERTTSLHTSTRKASKTSTPITSTFPPTATAAAATVAKDEPHRPHRPSRGGTTTETTIAAVKRSHKKGAGAAAQQLMAAAAAAAAADDEGSSMQGDDEEDEDESEPRYCYCNQVSYGEMVACDMEACPREWFHLDCVGLARAPNRNAKWYCDECKENLRRGRTSGGSR